MKKKERSIRLAELADGRDENNLAEFPLALLSDTPPKGVRSIEFEDTLDDWATGRRLTRRVCVTASDSRPGLSSNCGAAPARSGPIGRKRG
jgi:hypothetical protein